VQVTPSLFAFCSSRLAQNWPCAAETGTIFWLPLVVLPQVHGLIGAARIRVGEEESVIDENAGSASLRTIGVAPERTAAKPLLTAGSAQGQVTEGSQFPVPALQVCPAAQTTGGKTQLPVNGSQESTVHRLPSWQVFGVLMQPATGSQESTVHGLPSSQLTGGCVFRQCSLASQASMVQALPSSQS
jgi:hypothetical protein